jgi:hypothetical protein
MGKQPEGPSSPYNTVLRSSVSPANNKIVLGIMAAIKLRNVEFDDEFVESRNPHKYALLWASGQYKVINHNMRNYTPIFIKRNAPNTYTFVCKFARYFAKHGLSKEDLLKKGITKLYRGVTKDFAQDEIVDAGFMSTSHVKAIAKNFATRDGVVLRIDVATLPPNVPCVMIDESVDEDMMEEEVLLLPGTLTVRERKPFRLTYEPNISLVNMYKQTRASNKSQKGGFFPRFELAGKSLVFWRKIYGRPIEVLSKTQFPNNPDKVMGHYKKRVREIEVFMEKVTNMIPEFQDLSKYVKTMTENTEHNMLMYKKHRSYSVYMALVDTKLRKVETIHAFIMDAFFYEVFDVDDHDSVFDYLQDWVRDYGIDALPPSQEHT